MLWEGEDGNTFRFLYHGFSLLEIKIDSTLWQKLKGRRLLRIF